jgi:hypothetical protein
MTMGIAFTLSHIDGLIGWLVFIGGTLSSGYGTYLMVDTIVSHVQHSKETKTIIDKPTTKKVLHD